MRVIHKCRRQGSGSPIPQDLAGVLALSQSYRFVNNSGIAPFNREGGKFSGQRSISGGRQKVRECLYMAAVSASIHNPVIAAYVQGLRDRGKPFKSAIVAAMRKLLIHIQSLLKKSQLSPR